jgi:hypothetical protein
MAERKSGGFAKATPREQRAAIIDAMTAVTRVTPRTHKEGLQQTQALDGLATAHASIDDPTVLFDVTFSDSDFANRRLTEPVRWKALIGTKKRLGVVEKAATTLQGLASDETREAYGVEPPKVTRGEALRKSLEQMKTLDAARQTDTVEIEPVEAASNELVVASTEKTPALSRIREVVDVQDIKDLVPTAFCVVGAGNAAAFVNPSFIVPAWIGSGAICVAAKVAEKYQKFKGQ